MAIHLTMEGMKEEVKLACVSRQSAVGEETPRHEGRLFHGRAMI
jgi:hypothetical protein